MSYSFTRETFLQHLKKFSWLFWMFSGFFYQLFFLRADAFSASTMGGGAFSDPGIDAEPVRNFLLHGVKSISETGTVFKGPLLSLLWFFITPVCSMSFVVAKFIFLFIVTVVFFFIIKNHKQKSLWLLFYFLCCLHPLLGDYLHLPMGEWLSIVCIICAITFLKSFLEARKNISRALLFCFLFLLLAALFKVQYLYIILVFPLSLLLILPSFIYEKKTTIIFGKLFHVFVIIAGFAVLMWLIWYLPNKERFHFYYEKQQFFRLDRSWKDMSDTRHFWSRVLFYDGDWSVYRLPYKITLAIAFVILLLPKKFSFKPEIAFTLAWTIFEWHKFNFSYLPERYLLGIFVSGILLMLLVSFSLFQKLKFYAVPFIAVLFFLPLKWEIKTAVENFQNRKFTLINSQQKMKNYIHKNEVVLGAYASSLCWNTGCETHYINDTASNGKNIFTCFTPDYVICDSAEYDIGKAFSAQHVNIHDFATPLDTFRFSFLSAILYKVDKEKWNNMAVMKSN